MSRRLAVIGAGPIGLEMARFASAAGFDVRVYEAATIGGNLTAVRDVPLFTPFEMNSTVEARASLRRAGATLPPDDALLTAGELVSRCLLPMASLPELRGRIEKQTRVTAVGRDDLTKAKEIVATGATGRAERPFILRLETPGGSRLAAADIVIDASGTLSHPLATGPGGIPAIGEDALGDRFDRHLLPTRGATRSRFEGRRVLLIGCGYSAATALTDFETLARERAGPARVDWVLRDRGNMVFDQEPDDPLPARSALGRVANGIAARAPWLTRHAGCVIQAYERVEDGSTLVRLRTPAGREKSLTVDRVYSLAGYRPDVELFRELQIHLCYASEGPMALASAILAARATNPVQIRDCLAQKTHGPETLRTTEPNFYVIGAKSYGRNPGFFLRLGFQQIREVALLLPCAAPVAG